LGLCGGKSVKSAFFAVASSGLGCSVRVARARWFQRTSGFQERAVLTRVAEWGEAAGFALGCFEMAALRWVCMAPGTVMVILLGIPFGRDVLCRGCLYFDCARL
jgi:hypothetical protein